MVFSTELGYDPDEWEECAENEPQFMLFGFYTRMLMSLISVAFTVLFLWILEARKQCNQKQNQSSDDKQGDRTMGDANNCEFEAVKEKLEKLEINKQSQFTREEKEALDEWQREVATFEDGEAVESEKISISSISNLELNLSGHVQSVGGAADLLGSTPINKDYGTIKQSSGDLNATPSGIRDGEYASVKIPEKPIATMQDKPYEQEYTNTMYVSGFVDSTDEIGPAVAADDDFIRFSSVEQNIVLPPESGLPSGGLSGVESSQPAPPDGLIIGPEGLSEEENRRLAEAELFVQDAIEYINFQSPPAKAKTSGFIINTANRHKTQQEQQTASEATSELVGTNEVFEKLENDIAGQQPLDLDDAITYATEIQSFEIPPDQASLSSENLLEYFDHVAAECTDVRNLMGAENEVQMQQSCTIAARPGFESTQSISSMRSTRSVASSVSNSKKLRKQSSLLSVLGVTSMQEMLLTLTSLESLSDAMRKAGLESTNLIFGIDYTASNKYQGEHSFNGQSLHSIQPGRENPYQQVIKIMGRTLAPFASSGFIPAYGFGDAKTSDWSVFKLKQHGECRDFDEVLRVYDEITPVTSLSGPTNFAPLIYQAIDICQKVQDYHILVIVADGQVTNERATRKAIVQACQHPLSIIVVGVGDGPWDMMRVFDESLPKRPWDNFHFVEFHELMRNTTNSDTGKLSFAVQSLLEVPDQYNTIRKLGLIPNKKTC